MLPAALGAAGPELAAAALDAAGALVAPAPQPAASNDRVASRAPAISRRRPVSVRTLTPPSVWAAGGGPLLDRAPAGSRRRPRPLRPRPTRCQMTDVWILRSPPPARPADSRRSPARSVSEPTRRGVAIEVRGGRALAASPRPLLRAPTGGSESSAGIAEDGAGRRRVPRRGLPGGGSVPRRPRSSRGPPSGRRATGRRRASPPGAATRPTDRASSVAAWWSNVGTGMPSCMATCPPGSAWKVSVGGRLPAARWGTHAASTSASAAVSDAIARGVDGNAGPCEGCRGGTRPRAIVPAPYPAAPLGSPDARAPPRGVGPAVPLPATGRVRPLARTAQRCPAGSTALAVPQIRVGPGRLRVGPGRLSRARTAVPRRGRSRDPPRSRSRRTSGTGWGRRSRRLRRTARGAR